MASVVARLTFGGGFIPSFLFSLLFLVVWVLSAGDRLEEIEGREGSNSASAFVYTKDMKEKRTV